LRKEHRLEVFENRVLRKIFLPKRQTVKADWRKLHDENLHDLYFSPNIIRVIKSRRRRWLGGGGTWNVWRRNMYTAFWWVNLREDAYLKG
jgi:hypothetical protein